jgi:glycosyltransferase involved in cell wall biosynthesis
VQYALEVKRRNPKCLTFVHHHFAGYYDLRVGKLGVVPIWSDLLYVKMRREFESVDAHVFISEHCRRCYGRRIDFDTGKDMGLLKKQLLLGALYRPIKLLGSYVWYNGVDTSVFNCGGRKARTDEFVIGCVGNFNPCKRQIDLIKAFELVVKELPNAKLKLVGDGKTYNECVEYVNAHGMKNSVEFIARMSRNNLADFYRSIDLLVTPSVNEGFCCVNAESNYCGAPFIAVKGLPMEEVLDVSEHDRWLVAPHDVADLAKKVVEFVGNPQKQKLSADLNANNLARQFDDWTIAKWERSNA